MLIRTLAAALMAGTLAATPWPAGAAAGRHAGAARPLPGVTVDVSRLRALGLGPTAEIIQSAVSREAAGLAVPDGRVVLILTGFSMNSFAGVEGGGGGGGGGGSGGGSGGGAGENDYIEGRVVVVAPGGQVVRERVIVLSLPSNSGGPYYQPGSEIRRIEAISQNFARWAKRELG